MRTSPFLALLWAGVAVLATPCKPATTSSPVSSVSSSVSSAAPSASPVCMDAVVQNPDFGDGLAHWTTDSFFSASVYTVTASTDCGDYASCASLYAMSRYSGSVSDASVYQANIPVTPGATYTFTFRFRTQSSTGNGILVAVLDGIPLTTISLSAASTPTAWITYVRTWTAPTTATANVPDTSVASLVIYQRTYSGAITTQITGISYEVSVGTCNAVAVD